MRSSLCAYRSVSTEMVRVLTTEGIEVSLPKIYADASQLPPSPYKLPIRRSQSGSALESSYLVRREPTKVPVPHRSFSENPMNAFHMQEAFRWDADNRSAIFEQQSSSYAPIGSLLRLFYYPFPLLEGVKMPLRPMLSVDEIRELKWGTGDIPLYQTDTHKSSGPTVINSLPTADIPLYIPPAFRPEITKEKVKDNPPGKNTKYLTVHANHQPLSFYGQYIATEGCGSGKTMTLRNVIDGIGSEMIFHIFSPLVVAMQVVHRAEETQLPDMRFLRKADNQEASKHPIPRLDPLHVWRDKLGNVCANVPYLYLSQSP
jgi:ribosomal protein L19